MKIGSSGANVKEWQNFLKGQCFLALTVDGIFGAGTEAATRKFQLSKGLRPDGIVGPKTISFFKKEVIQNNKWPMQDYNSMVNFYGNVGEFQTSLSLPYKLKLAWDLNTEINRITCHTKVSDSLYNIFDKTLKHYGYDEIVRLKLNLFGGCLNVRRMRGGTAWSIHSWGAAVDLDPSNNQLRWGKDKATFARKDYDPFWKFVEEEGWISLGREKNYDWMHFQAARI